MKFKYTPPDLTVYEELRKLVKELEDPEDIKRIENSYAYQLGELHESMADLCQAIAIEINKSMKALQAAWPIISLPEEEEELSLWEKIINLFRLK